MSLNLNKVYLRLSIIVIIGGPKTDKIKILIAELVAGAVLVLAAYGLYDQWFSTLNIPEAAGVWLMLFLILLVIIDIFLIVYTLRSWELE